MAEVVAGRYRLIEQIGEGGMGRVWRAHDELLQRTVAVKELTTPLEDQVVREARAAARLDHPAVVRIFDVVRYEGRPWIVLEYVESRSLHRVVVEDGPLPVREVARIGVQVLGALRSAHAAGVLHRDVKPDNVLVCADGRVVLTDFGLATIGLTGGPDPRLGSPHYIAPERLGPEPAGVSGDLWSLGATLYAACEGRPPFGRGDPDASLVALLTEPPDLPERSGPLSTLFLALLDKEPERRPSAVEVDARLRAVLRSEPARGQAPVPDPSSRTRRLPLIARQIMALPRRAGLLVAVGAVVAAGGAAVLASGLGPGDPIFAVPAGVTASSPAPRPSVNALVSAPVDACGYGADAKPVEKAAGGVPAGLPRGWIWTRDPSGFALAVPDGWRRAMRGNEVCFSDPTGRRAFSVNVSPVVTSEPLEYWQRREKAERARGDLPGYTRVSMGVLLLKRGGADWEYTWRPVSGDIRHERRVLVAVTERRSYLLRWSVAGTDWAGTTGLQRDLVELFGSAR
ncbi:serine/threonine-protein kinase [Actinoplanes sp. NPDC051861]|uniref:serine/threonine-protein kinase n=1 Tax=Actinoplanes sp. NPDC051861 TaxID=3155170 RepID=UPI003422646B